MILFVSSPITPLLPMLSFVRCNNSGSFKNASAAVVSSLLNVGLLFTDFNLLLSICCSL